VRALGKTTPAYEALLALQTSLKRITTVLEKLETASTHPLYAQVLELANQLKATGVVKGGEKVMSLYDVSAKQAEDMEYLRKKLEDLKGIAEFGKEILAQKKKEEKKPIIKKSW
jgi:DNA-binding transcriptional regulator YhcF (GntR family)